MKSFITATLGGLAALSIAAAIALTFIPSRAGNKPVHRTLDADFPSEKFNARGSGRDEEETLISNSESEEDPPEKPAKTEIASKSGEAQTTHKDATAPPSGEPRGD